MGAEEFVDGMVVVLQGALCFFYASLLHESFPAEPRFRERLAWDADQKNWLDAGG